MKALVYHGPGKREWEEKPKPVIKDSTDAIIRVTKTTILRNRSSYNERRRS